MPFSSEQLKFLDDFSTEIEPKIKDFVGDSEAKREVLTRLLQTPTLQSSEFDLSESDSEIFNLVKHCLHEPDSETLRIHQAVVGLAILSLGKAKDFFAKPSSDSMTKSLSTACYSIITKQKERLDIEQIGLGSYLNDADWQAFWKIIEASKLKALMLWNTGLSTIKLNSDNTRWVSWCKPIPSTSLTVLNLESNFLGNFGVPAWEAFWQAINASMIDTLYLGQNNLHELDPGSLSIFCQELPVSKLRLLSLSTNMLKHLTGLPLLLKAVFSAPHLQEVRFNDNEINEFDPQCKGAFWKGLSTSHIEVLELDITDVTSLDDPNWQEFWNAVQSSKLKSLIFGEKYSSQDCSLTSYRQGVLYTTIKDNFYIQKIIGFPIDAMLIPFIGRNSAIQYALDLAEAASPTLDQNKYIELADRASNKLSDALRLIADESSYNADKMREKLSKLKTKINVDKEKVLQSKYIRVSQLGEFKSRSNQEVPRRTNHQLI